MNTMKKTLDGIKKISKKQGNKSRPETKTFFGRKRFDHKIIATILITFVLTFIASIATSEILAQPKGQVLGASTDLAYDNALPVSSGPVAGPAFDNIVLSEPPTVFLPNENISATDPLIDREEFLKQYLAAKNSPLADHVDAISAQSQWKLIVAIAQAESSSCKKYPQHTSNCWGIGGANNLMQFPDLDAAIAHVNQLLENKYVSQGLDSPQKLVNKWVGHPNNQWEQAVSEVLDNLKNVQ